MYFHQDGRTPLICAAQFGKAEVVRLFLDAGASIEAKNNVSKRIFICTHTYIYTYVCVCVWRRGGNILP